MKVGKRCLGKCEGTLVIGPWASSFSLEPRGTFNLHFLGDFLGLKIEFLFINAEKFNCFDFSCLCFLSIGENPI